MNTMTRSELKAAVKEKGSFYFSAGAMRFFRSRLESDARQGRDGRFYFVTSEQFDDNSPRLYSVRAFRPYAENRSCMDNVSEFQEFKTKDDAIWSLIESKGKI